jgi:adenine phosphoribosyltransferase
MAAKEEQAGEKTLPEQLLGAMRNYTDFKPGIVFRDIGPLLASPPLLRGVVDDFAEFCQTSAGRIDTVVALEGRGWPLGAPLAYLLNIPFVWVRKAGKLPGKVHSASYGKIYGSDACELSVGALSSLPKRDKKTDQEEAKTRVVLIDDFYSTGGSLLAARDVVEADGAEVAAACVIFENALVDASTRQSLPFPLHFIARVPSPNFGVESQ